MYEIILSRKELYEKVWSKPMVVLAREFNLSDNGLRKICKKHNIPLPVIGHWQKVQNGKKTSTIKLPKSKNEEPIKINILEKKLKSPETVLEINLISEKISTNKSLILKVPEKLNKPDSIIIKTQNNLKGKKPNDYSRIKGTIQTDRGFPSITVTPKNIPRTLIVLDNLIKNFRLLKYNVEIKEDGLTIVAYEDIEIKISIREIYNSIQIDNDYGWKTRELVPNGKLAIKAGLFGTYEFVDSIKGLIEDQILKILIKVETDFSQMNKLRRLRQLEQEKIEELQKIESQRQKLKEDELNKFIQFYNNAHRWKKYNILKEYFDFIKNQSDKTSQTEEWLQWASKKLDWYNPLTEISEGFLDDVDKDSLTFKKKTWY